MSATNWRISLQPATSVLESHPVVRQACAPLKYRADIDGLRAVAVTLVLVFHFSLTAQAKAGFLGVDIFFVVSGFLITIILTKQLDKGTFSLATFYANRIQRLAPALLTVMLMVSVAGLFLLFPNDLSELIRQVVASQFYVANIYYWQRISYFGLAAQESFLLHTWSLAVEEQFYLVYPVCILLLHRYLKKFFWTALVFCALVSFCINIILVSKKPEAVFYLLPARAWELLLGALVPLVAIKWVRGRYADELIGLFGATLIIICVIYYRDDFYSSGLYALLPTIGAACLLLSAYGRTTGVSQALSSTPVVYIGKISYSLYLVHWPINVFASMLIVDYSWGWRLAMFALSIVLAALVYHIVEDPVRHERYLGTRRKILFGYATGLVAILSIFVVVNVTSGLPQRFPLDVLRVANYADDRTAPLKCEFSGQTFQSSANFCKIGAADRSPSWLMYGDSHAWAAYAVLDKWLKVNGEAGLFTFAQGCAPLNDVYMFGYKGGCFAFNRAVTDFIENHPELKNIVLVSIWRQGVEGLLSTSPNTLLTKTDLTQLFIKKFAQTLEHLHDLGRRVFVWEPVPGARKNVPREMARSLWDHRPLDIEISLSQYLSDNEVFFGMLKANRRWISGSFSAWRTLCITGKCAVEHDGTPLYFDNNHMTSSTADVWATILRESAALH